jgi:hypothetical protein
MAVGCWTQQPRDTKLLYRAGHFSRKLPPPEFCIPRRTHGEDEDLGIERWSDLPA